MRKIFFTILFSLALALPAYSQSNLLKVRIDRFHEGQNSTDLVDIINPAQGELMQNIVLNKKGQLFKRKGQSLFSEDESNIAWTGLGIFNPDQNTKYILAASGIDIIREDTSPASWLIVNPTFKLTLGKDTEFVQANKSVFIFNGFDNTASYDGTTWDEGSSSTASPPSATTAVWLRNYLFAAGNSTNPDWIFFSNNLDPTLYTASDIVKVNTGDGQKIVRLEAFKLNELIAYKERSIYTLDITGTTPLSDWTLQPITRAIGCDARRSVVNLGNDHWFLSNEPFAVRSLVRTSFDKLLTEIVSRPIQDIFDGTGDITINKTVIEKACAILFDNKYILAIPTRTSITNNYVVLFDFITKAWYVIDGWFPAAWVEFDNDLYYIDALDGRVVKCFTGTKGDMASGPIVTATSEPNIAIEYDYIGKNIDFDNPEIFKQLDAMEVEFEAVGNYTAEVFVNLDNSGFQSVGTVNFSDDVPTLPNTLPITLTSKNIARKTFHLSQFGEFRKIRVRVIQNGLNQLCNLHSYTIFINPKSWRRE